MLHFFNLCDIYYYKDKQIMKYKVSTYARLHNVTIRTVWNWYYKGLLKTERDSTNHLWIIENENDKSKELNVAVYARVSSAENKTNLNSQVDRVVSYCNAKGYKVAKVVKEIGSGLNDSRQKLEALLLDKSIDIIVVEHKDRLARFGLNYIQKLLEMQNRKIEVINNFDNDSDELMQDFVSIITSFCARLYGKRRTKRNTEKLIKELQKE